VKPGNRLRKTWQPEAWLAPATLQLTLSEWTQRDPLLAAALVLLELGGVQGGPFANQSLRSCGKIAVDDIAGRSAQRALCSP
jgi:hypothetical protein